MRLRNNPNALEEMRETGLLIENYPVSIDSGTVLELGMGKGEMICELAKSNPTVNYIGIEKFATVAAKAAKRAKKLELTNLKFIVDDISNLPEILKGQVDSI